MKFKNLNEILIIDLLTILLIFAIILIPSTAARVILGLPFYLFFPGYTLVAALFVRKNAANHIEKVALSTGMSIAIVGLIGFALNYTPWGIRLYPVLYSITGFVLLTSVIALIRRARVSKTANFITELNLNFADRENSRFNRLLTIIVIMLILGAFGVLGYTIAFPKIGEKFTEFYIQGINSKAEYYPTDFTMYNGKVIQVLYSNGTLDTISGMGVVTLGIVNHEQQTAVYSVTMTIDGDPVSINFGGTTTNSLGPIKIKQGEMWENPIGIVPQHIGDNQKVEILLFNDDKTSPEDSLHFWINVE